MLAELRQSVITEFRHSVCKNRRRQHGDAAAFLQLVASHRPALHAHCYWMLGSVQDAEDALQEALLNAWRALQ